MQIVIFKLFVSLLNDLIMFVVAVKSRQLVTRLNYTNSAIQAKLIYRSKMSLLNIEPSFSK